MRPLCAYDQTHHGRDAHDRRGAPHSRRFGFALTFRKSAGVAPGLLHQQGGKAQSYPHASVRWAPCPARLIEPHRSVGDNAWLIGLTIQGVLLYTLVEWAEYLAIPRRAATSTNALQATLG
jgi:hypothetical protein